MTVAVKCSAEEICAVPADGSPGGCVSRIGQIVFADYIRGKNGAGIGNKILAVNAVYGNGERLEFLIILNFKRVGFQHTGGPDGFLYAFRV